MSLPSLVPVLHQLLVSTAAVLPGTSGAPLLLGLVLITVAVRLMLLPLAVRAFRRRRSVAALAPDIDRLKRRHRQEPDRLLRELRRLHADAGVSPFAGLGAGLLQLPVLFTLYSLATAHRVAGMPNALTTAQLGGMQLSTHWVPAVFGAGLVPGLAYGGLVLGLLVVAWLSWRQQTEGPRLLRLAPFATAGFAALAPIAVSVYLLSSTAWTVAERTALTRWA